MNNPNPTHPLLVSTCPLNLSLSKSQPDPSICFLLVLSCPLNLPPPSFILPSQS